MAKGRLRELLHRHNWLNRLRPLHLIGPRDELDTTANAKPATIRGAAMPIRANQWLDFSAAYTFTNRSELEIGRIIRKGWTSLWKAHYEILDGNQHQDLLIREENPWAKVFDSMLSEVPLVGVLTGYFFHPAYIVTRPDGTQIVRLRKVVSFFGRSFVIDKLNQFETGEEERILLGLMMLILLERRRG